MENSNPNQSQARKPKPQGKLKVFQVTLQNFAIAGITPNLLHQSYPLNGKISTGFLILGLSMICYFEYTFYEAKTFIEYTQTIYLGSLAALIIFALVIIVGKVKKLFEFMDECEHLVNSC